MPLQNKQQPPYYQEGTFKKTYTALLTQTGTAAPIANILENTIGTITWTRSNLGQYTATKTNAFTENKTLIQYFGSDWLGNILITMPVTDQSTITGYITVERINENAIMLQTYDPSFNNIEWSTLIDATPIPITIQIYS